MKYLWLLLLCMVTAAQADTLEELLPSQLPTTAAWQIAAPAGHDDLHSVYFVDAEHGWAVGDRGAVFFTEDGGGTWFARLVATRATLEDVRFADAQTGFAVGDNGTLLVTTDGGEHWNLQPVPTRERLSRILVDGQTVILGGDNGAVLTSADRGRTWTAGSVGDKVPCYGAAWLGPGQALLVGGRSVVYETRFGRYVSVASRLTQKRMPTGIFLSPDDGRHWTRSVVPTKDPMYAVACANPYDAIAVGGDVRLSRDWLKGKVPSYGHPVIIVSRDAGQTWTEVKVPESFTGNLLDVWAWPDLTVWAVGFENQPGLPLMPIPTDGPVQPVYLFSTDGGSTWTRMDWPTLKVVEHLWFVDPMHGWAVGPRGVVERYLPTWRVERLYNQQKYADAAQTLDVLGPDASLQYVRALLQLRLGQLDAARASLANAQDARSLYLRAVLEYHDAQLDAAMQDVRDATRLAPDDADAFYLGGLMAEPRLARPYFERYLLLDPDGDHAIAARKRLN